MPEIIVIGAGISGLTVAYKLARAGKDVIVLESSETAGGKIITERVDGYLLESGPNSLRVDNQETVDLIDELGLTDRVIEANPTSKKRFILKNGHWIKIPGKPGEAISTPLFSLGEKLRILLEPFIPKTKLEDESAASFVRRRLGHEVFDYAADPFITGIYAGDPGKLSMRYAFSQMWRAEQEYGSLILGMLKRQKHHSTNSIKPRVISFPEGLSELTNAIRSELGKRIEFSDQALHIEKKQDGYIITTSSRSIEAKTIIFALPAYEASTLIAGIAPDLSGLLVEINYPFVGVVYLGYRNDQFEKIPEGFGGLIPSNEKRNILGIIYSSSNFPNRAPDNQLLLTIIMGGASNPDIANFTNEEILKVAIGEVSELLRARGTPIFQHIRMWKRAIPQYNVGYEKFLNAISLAEKENPGLYFIGNYRGGIAMGACIRNATELTKRLV